MRLGDLGGGQICFLDRDSGLEGSGVTLARRKIKPRRYQWWYLRLAILFTEKLPNLGALYVPDQFTCEVRRGFEETVQP